MASRKTEEVKETKKEEKVDLEINIRIFTQKPRKN